MVIGYHLFGYHLLFLINQLPYPTMLHQNIQSFVKFYLSDKILQQDLQKKRRYDTNIRLGLIVINTFPTCGEQGTTDLMSG